MKMGAEMSSSSKDYEFEQVEASLDGVKDLYTAKRKDGDVFSAFCWETSKRKEDESVVNAAKYLKVLRHPGIVKYFDYVTTPKKVYLLTEKIEPLSTKLDSLHPLNMVSGIHNIVEAVSFLHEKCKLSHNNLCMNSIFVTKNGKWKLAGMQYLSSFDSLNKPFIDKLKKKINKKVLCPEDKDGTFKFAYSGHERDSYAISILCQSILDENIEGNEYYDMLKENIELFQNIDPAQRPPVKTLTQNKLFQNEFLNTLKFLEKLTMKSSTERNIFFKEAGKKLSEIPVDLVVTKLSSLLFSRFVLLDKSAQEYLLPHLFIPCKERRSHFVEGEINSLFTVDIFKTKIIPLLVDIFKIKNVSIRLVLLHYFHQYVKYIPKTLLQDEVFPQILLGLKDTNDGLVIATLRALADIVPILGGSVVVGNNQTKLFSNASPKENVPDATSKNGIFTDPPSDQKKIQEIEDKEMITRTNVCEAVDNFTTYDTEVNQRNHTNLKDFVEEAPQPKSKYSLPPLISLCNKSEPTNPEVQIPAEPKLANSDWSDWESLGSDTEETEPDTETSVASQTIVIQQEESLNAKPGPISKNKVLGDEFDIFSSFSVNKSDNVDLFEDMEPVISKSTTQPEITATKSSDMFAVKKQDLEQEPENGWGDDLDWESFS